MGKTKGRDAREVDKLEYAVALIEDLAESEGEPLVILENALRIMAFGELTPKQMIDYLEATN